MEGRRLYQFDDGSMLGLFGPFHEISNQGGRFTNLPKEYYLGCHLSPSASILLVETIYEPSIPIDKFDSEPPDDRRAPRRLAQMDKDLWKIREAEMRAVRVTRERFMSSQAPSKYWPFVEFLLAFRNTYSTVPYVPSSCLHLLKRLDGPSPTPSSRIHQNPSAFSHYHIISSKKMISPKHSYLSDQSVKLNLARNGQTFSVRFPVAIEDAEELVEKAKDESKQKKRGRRHEKCLCIYGLSKCFLLEMHLKCGGIHWSWCIGGYPSKDIVDLAKRTGHIVDRVTSLFRFLWANQNTSPSHISNAKFSPSVDSVLHPLTPKPLKMLWNEKAVFRIIPTEFQDSRIQDFDIEAVLHSDGAVFRTSDAFNFIILITSESDLAQEGDIYPANDSPETVTNFSTGAKYPLIDLKTTMLKLYHNACHSLSERVPIPSSPSIETLERESVL
ncbi:hypothetical protein BC829DRAFT_436398 [Chytridium lagenaria]|nr:hypothetical protein BC829DRAFT_436398 [Chytridium lagenaria]